MADMPKYGLAGSTNWLRRPTAGTVRSAPLAVVYVFHSHWRVRSDLQGTEMNVDLFKRKTGFQKAACSREHSLPCAALFG